MVEANAKRFMEQYPDIKVEYVGIAATEYQSKVDTAIQGGGLPDVGGVGAAMAPGSQKWNGMIADFDSAPTSSSTMAATVTPSSGGGEPTNSLIEYVCCTPMAMIPMSIARPP